MVVLGCKNNHKRSIIPSNLISRNNGSVCNECAGKAIPGKKSHESFVTEILGIYPNLKVLGTYTGAKVPINVSCNHGHTWSTIPSNLLSRASEAICKVCTPKTAHNLLSIEEVNTNVQVHYPYLKVIEYTNSYEHAQVLDTRCGKVAGAYTGNLSRGLAYKCIHCEPHLVGTSAMEQAVLRFVKSQYKGWVVEQDKSILAPKHLDIVLPDLGVAIEFNGMFYHQENKCNKFYHLNKTKGVEDFGYKLVHIYDSEWITKRDIVESRLRSILGTSTKVYARNTILKPIEFPKEFLDVNHIQGGGAPSSINYGLFFDEELIAVMTFSKPKFNKTDIYDYELVRYCSILNVTVVGGASKLLKKFCKEHPGTRVMSYADKRWSTGGMYKTLGFEHLRDTEPNYVYYKNSFNILNRYACTKPKLQDRFPSIYKEELTQDEILQLAGYSKVYDCGNSVWKLNT